MHGRCATSAGKGGTSYPSSSKKIVFFFRFLPTVSVVLYRDYPIEYPSKDGQKSKFLNCYKGPLFNTLFQLVQHELLWIHPGCPARSHPRCARAVQHEGRARALLEARGARRCTASRRDPNPNSSPRIALAQTQAQAQALNPNHQASTWGIVVVN